MGEYYKGVAPFESEEEATLGEDGYQVKGAQQGTSQLQDSLEKWT